MDLPLPTPQIPRLDISAEELQRRLPSFGHAGLQAHQKLKNNPGKILRLRLGMNPNSSSVGTNVIVFMWTLTSCAAIFTIASGLLAARFADNEETEEAEQEENSGDHG